MPEEYSMTPRNAPDQDHPFVNREKEIAILKHKLDLRISKGEKVKSGVMCFWGPFGMGKSWLLGEIERLYRPTDGEQHGAYPVIVARLDLSKQKAPTLWVDGAFQRELLIEELWAQLASQTIDDQTQTKGASVPRHDQVTLTEYVNAFVDQVTKWSTDNYTPLIMLDTVDDLIAEDEKAFGWIEKAFVERLAMTDHVLFVFSSRGEITEWDTWQVRRRIDSFRLDGFSREMASKALKIEENKKLGDTLYRYTFGHPFSNEKLAFFLEQKINEEKKTNERLRKLLISDEEIDKHMGEILNIVIEKVIEEVLRVMPNKELGQVVRNVCVLRWVSVEPLRYLCEGLSLLPASRGDNYYNEIIATLQMHHLLYWSDETNHYEFEPVLRRIMAFGLYLSSPEDRYRRAHHLARQFHQDHLEKFPDALTDYVPEMVFHTTALQELSPADESITQAFVTWWGAFPDSSSSSVQPQPKHWELLKGCISGDEDLDDRRKNCSSCSGIFRALDEKLENQLIHSKA